MAKQIVTKRIILDMNADGTFKSGVLQYRIRTDGALDPKVRTMSVGGGIAVNQTAIDRINSILAAARQHIERGEGIL